MNIPCEYVPVTWKNKPNSRINILACAVRDPIDMLRIRLRDVFGIYKKPMVDALQPWSSAA